MYPLKVQPVELRRIYWQKWDIILRIIFLLVYHMLKIRTIEFYVPYKKPVAQKGQWL